MKDETITIGVQIDGKTVGTVDVATDASEDEIRDAARNIASMRSRLRGREVERVIHNRYRLVNFVTKAG